MLHAQVLVLAQVGGNLFWPARHQASVVAGVILEDAIGAENQVHGIFGSPGPGADAAQSCDFLGQFLRFQYGRRSQSDGHPAVAQRRRPPDCRVSVAANPNGRVRFLHRLGQEPNAADFVVLAVKLWLLGRPKLFENLDVLVGNLAALGVGIEPHRLELFLHPAHAGTEDEPAAAQHVQRRQDLGSEHRVAVREDKHVGAQFDPSRAAGQEIQRGQRFEVGIVSLERSHAIGGVRVEGVDLVGNHDMVAHPHVVKGQVFGPLGQAAQVVRRRHFASAGERASE